MDRLDPPPNGTEREVLVGYLDFHRATLMQKVAGLDAGQLATALPPAEMTLGGMVKHCALNEEYWFCHRVAGQPEAEPWASVDWDADRDWEWHSAVDDEPDELIALWRASVEKARAALAGADLEAPIRTPLRDGTTPSVRWVLVHMIEEYARHNGHADLIRQSVDGLTGE